MENPIIDGRLRWADISFEIDPDYDNIRITRGGITIEVPFRSLVDLKGLLDKQRESDGEELASKRLWNSIGTSHALPYASWD